MTFTIATLLLSLVVLTGYAGQVSLAQFTIAGIGGLIAAQLAAHAGFGFLPALVVGTLGATVDWAAVRDPGAAYAWRQPCRNHARGRVGGRGHAVHQPVRLG